jgi:hypothetical protein
MSELHFGKDAESDISRSGLLKQGLRRTCPYEEAQKDAEPTTREVRRNRFQSGVESAHL